MPKGSKRQPVTDDAEPLVKIKLDADVDMSAPIPETPKATSKPKVEKQPPAPPPPAETPIRLPAFLRIAGKRPEQLAGFERWVLNQEPYPKPRSVRAWRELLEQSENRPVR